MSSAQVPEGYKQTEIGVIPKDWDATQLGNIAEVIMGQSPKGTSYNREGNGLALINGPTEFTDKCPIEVQWTTEPTKLCKLGDLLLCVRGSSTGRMNIANHEFCIGRGVAAIRANGKSVTEYLTYQVYLEIEKLLSLSTGSTFPSVDGKAIKSIPIPHPPLPEQRAIAQALSDVDALIASLDKLIAKQRQLKTAAMQQLLTGKMRLSDFGEGMCHKQTEVGMIPEDWIVTEMKNIVENNRISSGIYKEKSLYGNGNPIIKLGDVFNLDYFDPSKSQRVLLEDDELSKYRVNVGDIFIALASVKLEGVGKVMLVTELDEDTAYDHNIALIRVNNLANPKFIFYILKSDFVRNKVSKAATQVGTTFLKASTILAFQLPIPIKAEQAEIATVLSDMDAAIAALEIRRAKTQAIKQGMMQELLTGRTRLV
jgi:type I restriction enzyme, S subunit